MYVAVLLHMNPYDMLIGLSPFFSVVDAVTPLNALKKSAYHLIILHFFKVVHSIPVVIVHLIVTSQLLLCSHTPCVLART